jgi:hypothetical protein
MMATFRMILADGSSMPSNVEIAPTKSPPENFLQPLLHASISYKKKRNEVERNFSPKTS